MQELDVTQSTHGKQEYPPMHTAEHILNQTMIRIFGCPRSLENHVERKKSKCHYQLSAEPSADEMAEVERRVNEVIEMDLEVKARMVDRSEVPSGVSLAALPSDAEEMLRLVSIGDYDDCLCAGAHVRRTSEIGRFRISSYSFDEGKLRIVYRLDSQDNQTEK